MENTLKILADWKDSVKHSIERAPHNENFSIVSILNWTYAIAGLVAAGFIVYGAVNYLMAQGESAKIKQASQTIAFAVIGLIVVLIATAVTNFIASGVAA
jgi:hypothetical protein